MQAIDYIVPPVIVVSVDVTDLEKAAAFYTQILGFKRGWDRAKQYGWLEIDIPFSDFKIGLNLLRNSKVSHGSTTLSFGVKDIAATKAYLEVNNIIIGELNEIPGMVKTLEVDDPDGNKLLFVEDLRVAPGC
jgi:catechol 2,3-dioxygenase-like lactoylglutathione lyase family enzyme